MGLLAKALERRATMDVGVKPAENPPDNWVVGGLMASGAGVTITPEMSMQISTVYACVRNLAEDVAKLPLILYERTSQGKTRAPQHPIYQLMHDLPNPEMSAMDMRSTLQGHLGSWGNCYAYINWDNRGQISELWPLRPDCMGLRRDLVSGELIYDYAVSSVGVMYHWPRERVFHVRGLGSDGLTGYDPVRLQMRSQGLAWATEEFGSRFFGNGARPGVVYTHPGQLSDTAFKHLQTSMEDRYTGLENSHRVKILEEGMGVETIGIPPEEAQFLQTRQFQVIEIARWYRMPPHKIMDLERATFSNIEEQSLDYVTDTLMPWLVRWEQAGYRSLLLPRERSKFYFEHLLDGMLRGKTLERYQAYHLALTDGWKNRNEVRQAENLNQVDGLDEFMTQLNMGPASAPAAGARALSAEEWKEMEIWQRKVAKAAASGGGADVPFEIKSLSAELAGEIRARLKNARTVEDVNRIFDEARQAEPGGQTTTVVKVGVCGDDGGESDHGTGGIGAV